MCKLLKKVFKKEKVDIERLKSNYPISLRNLYVGQLGVVKNAKEENYVNWISLENNSWIAFEKYNSDGYHHDYSDYAKDILTNSEYYFFKNYNEKYKIGDIYLYNCIPLSTLTNEQERNNGYISKERVLEILYYLNNREKVEEENNEPVTDKVMKEIMKVLEIIKQINDDAKKESFKLEISNLATYYAKEKIEISMKSTQVNNESTLTLCDSENFLINKCLEILTDLEIRVKNELSLNGIRNDLMLLQRSVSCK